MVNKKKCFKVVAFSFTLFVLFYLSFMTGRYSWLIAKPSFLIKSKDFYYIDNARQELQKEGMTEKELSNPWLQKAVIVYFKNSDGGQNAEVVLEKESGQILQYSRYK